MTREEAARWLDENGRKPWELPYGEARWYPATESNLTGKGRDDWFFVDIDSCLLPPGVYHGMAFPKPEGWGDRVYPWFPSVDAAVDAATESVWANARLPDSLRERRERGDDMAE